MSDRRGNRLRERGRQGGARLIRGLRSRASSLRSSESGFYWVELLVAMVMALIVGAAALTFMVVTFHEQNNISSRTTATNQAESGLEALVRDLRGAVTSVTVTNPTGSTTQISFYIPTPGSFTTNELVTWTCPSTSATALGTCTRAVTPSGGGTTTRAVITGVQSMAFSPVSSSNTTLSLPVTSSTSVASVGMTLDVRITTYGVYTTATTAIAGAANAPIVLQATADLRNFA